ncbi:MAG: hypothetical protein KGS61_18565 [Verrucomicrobia bacterium]|nr:hypothetical protein [Verrucomicrobiota bacterium]
MLEGAGGKICRPPPSMPHSTALQNYLRTFRKRSSLSQTEIAFLLGDRDGSKICRHERFARQPGLATAFAYEVIFQTPASKLFSGLYREVERQVVRRAEVLTARLSAPESKSTARKLEILGKIVAPAQRP